MSRIPVALATNSGNGDEIACSPTLGEKHFQGRRIYVTAIRAGNRLDIGSRFESSSALLGQVMADRCTGQRWFRHLTQFAISLVTLRNGTN